MYKWIRYSVIYSCYAHKGEYRPCWSKEYKYYKII